MLVPTRRSVLKAAPALATGGTLLAALPARQGLAAPHGLNRLREGTAALPSITFTDADGKVLAPADFAGKGLVINLWATWCPPCRREMPVLARAQATHADVVFAFANQGESAAEVEDFLRRQPFALRNVLRDDGSQLMVEAGSRGLPTTLFFDARGRLADTHMGELTEAGLAQKLQRLGSR